MNVLIISFKNIRQFGPPYHRNYLKTGDKLDITPWKLDFTLLDTCWHAECVFCSFEAQQP